MEQGGWEGTRLERSVYVRPSDYAEECRFYSKYNRLVKGFNQSSGTD